MSSDTLTFRSWGFELHVPPAPFSIPPAPARFVMLDDINGSFYDVDYDTPLLGNKVSWTELALYNIPDPAIVFPPEQQNKLQETGFATGFLVAIDNRDATLLTARKLGKVNVSLFPPRYMNWSALAGLKGRELPAEMRAGLLRRVWDRRPGLIPKPTAFVTPARILNGMPRPWHKDGVALNYELDERFVGCKTLGPPSRWKVSGIDPEQIEKSTTRAADCVEAEQV